MNKTADNEDTHERWNEFEEKMNSQHETGTPKWVRADLEKAFRNHTDCYADTLASSEVIPAMTEKKFMEVVIKLIDESSSVSPVAENNLSSTDIKEGLRNSYGKVTGDLKLENVVAYADWMENKIVEYRAAPLSPVVKEEEKKGDEPEDKLTSALRWALAELELLNDQTKQLPQIEHQLPIAKQALQDHLIELRKFNDWVTKNKNI